MFTQIVLNRENEKNKTKQKQENKCKSQDKENPKDSTPCAENNPGSDSWPVLILSIQKETTGYQSESWIPTGFHHGSFYYPWFHINK